MFQSSRHSGQNAAPSAKRQEASGCLDESNKVRQSAEQIWAQFAILQCTLHSCGLQIK